MSKKKTVTSCPRAPSPGEVKLVIARFKARIDGNCEGKDILALDCDQAIYHSLSWALTGSADGHTATGKHESKVSPPSREMIEGAKQFSIVRGLATNYEGVHSRWSSTSGALEWFLHGRAIGEDLQAELSRMDLLDKFEHRGREGRAVNPCPCGDWSGYKPTCSICRGLGLPEGSPHDIDNGRTNYTWCPECSTSRPRKHGVKS